MAALSKGVSSLRIGQLELEALPKFCFKEPSAAEATEFLVDTSINLTSFRLYEEVASNILL